MNILSLFNPPKFDDPEQDQAARMLYGVLWLMIFAVIVIGIGSLAFQPANASRTLIPSSIMVGSCILGLVLLRRQRLKEASILSVAQIWLVVTLSALTGGGMETPAVQGYILVILAAGLLIGWRWGLFTGLVSAICMIGLTFAETTRLLPPYQGVRTPLTYLIVYTLISSLAIIFVYYYTSSLKTALNSAKQELAERKLAEQALSESEARLRVFAGATFEGIAISVNEHIIESNEQFARMLGYTNTEILGKNVPQLVAPGSLQLVRQHIAEEYSEAYEAMLIRKDGTYIPVEIHGRPFAYRGQIARLSAIRDLTERKAAEDALHESEERFQNAFQYAAIGMALVSPDGRWLKVNQALCRLVGYSEDELLAQTFQNITHPKDLDAVLGYISKMLADEIRTYQLEKRYIHKSGQDVWVLLSVSLVRDARGVPLYFIAQVEDISQRKLAEQENRRQLAHITALHAIDSAILSSIDVKTTFNIIIEHVLTRLGADATAFYLLNQHRPVLEFASGSGFSTAAFEHDRQRLGDDLVGQVALGQTLLHVADITRIPDTSPRKQPMLKEGFVSYVGVPLIVKGEMKGVLEVFHRSAVQPDHEWLDFLTALAGQAAIAINNLELFQELKSRNLELALAYDVTLEGWSKALDLRDKETEGHTLRVTEMAVRLGRAMGLPEKELVYLRQGALLHDIGKLGIPDSILLKAGKLTDDEWAIMRRHPIYAYEWLSPIAYLRPALDIPHYHHERWDGGGYPHRLSGEAIPLAARIFSVADVYDALTSDRPYRSAWPHQKALKHIRDQSERHFDPQVVDAFLQMMRDSL